MVIVIETEATEVDLATRTCQERDNMKAMATKRILASCDDTRYLQDHSLACGGFSESSILLPSINRGKRFFDATINQQGSIAIISNIA